MSNRFLTGFVFYLVAPFIVTGVAFGLWLSVMAMLENQKIGNAFDQTLYVWDVARTLRVGAQDSPDRALHALMNRLEEEGKVEVIPLSGAFLGSVGTRGIKDPWGGEAQVFFYPSYGAFRFESPVSANACRRLLTLYGKASDELGLLRVDVRTGQEAARGNRLVYEKNDKDGKKALQESAIASGCGLTGEVLLSLTFQF